jgi:MFS family permease
MALSPANALYYKPYIFYTLALRSAGFAIQILSVSVGWQVYDMTRNPLDLGFVGLAQFLPALLMVLLTGLTADRFNRRMIIAICFFLEMLCALALLYIAMHPQIGVLPIFGVLFLLGTARAFMNPAADALTPNLLPKIAIASGISLNSMLWQVTSITGPVIGGLLYGASAYAAFGTATGLLVIGAIFLIFIGSVPQMAYAQGASLSTLFAGFKFIRFAVLLGGAVALMPVYARDILDVGPWGLGLLRSAPGIGAVAVALYLSFFPIRDRAGIILFVSVAAFGLSTMAFGLSTYVPLSITALILIGGFDMVSVYVRETLMQLWTPDHVRGRVNAVNRVFIGASNELGEFRAGVVAALTGTVAAVTLGGAGTIAVAALWSKWFPQLRNARALDGTG